MATRLGTIAWVQIDCRDPDALRRFWAELLGMQDDPSPAPPAFRCLLGVKGGPGLSFQRVPQSKIIKNRVHLDVIVDDLEAATRWVEDDNARFDREPRPWNPTNRSHSAPTALWPTSSPCSPPPRPRTQGSRAAGLAMAFKPIGSAQTNGAWSNAPHLVALVGAGATFINGKFADRPREQAQPAAPENPHPRVSAISAGYRRPPQ